MKLARAFGALGRRAALLTTQVPFDPDFYRTRYPDVAHLSPAALRRHYLTFGREEGRQGHPAEAVTMGTAGRPAPADFEAASYLRLNPDLTPGGVTLKSALAHYLAHGAREGRPFRNFNAAVYRELYFSGVGISDAELERHFLQVGRAEGRIGNAAAFLASEGAAGATWADALKPEEWRLLNASWAGDGLGLLDTLRRMADEGIRRLAPLSFALRFDPAYYREAHPRLSRLDDAGLYRHWLGKAFGRTPGSPEEHLRLLRLPLRAFPDAFRWRAYARSRPGLNTRWAALDHLVRQAGTPPVEPGQPGADVLTALGRSAAEVGRDEDAVRLFAAALTEGRRDGVLLYRLGRSLARLGRWREAYHAHAEAAGTPDATPWTFTEGAQAALRLARPDLAFDLAMQGRGVCTGFQAWREAVAEAIEAQFRQSWTAAERLYAAGARREGDEAMNEAADHAAEQWCALDPLGSVIPAHPSGRVVVLANVDLVQCTRYRVSQKADLLDRLGLPYAIFAQAEVEAFLSALPGASAAIFYRLPATPGNIRAILAARAMGIATYYDIDDLVFDADVYPEPVESYSGVSADAYAGLQLGVPLFRAAMALCDRGIASTTALAAHMRPLVRTGEVDVLPNALDHLNERFLDAPAKPRRPDGEVVVFYGSGTKAHNSDFIDLAGPALLDLMMRLGNVRLVVAGYLELDESFDPVRSRITFIGFMSDPAAYMAALAQADINLAVLRRNPVTDAKSEIKWIEAAVLGAPSIVSDTDRFREVVTDGVDALIASDPQGWMEALERLVASPELRRSLAEAARETLRRNYTLQANSRRLDAILPKPDAAPRAGGRTRILLLNTFFPPQTIGGATRVLRDNLDYMLDYAGDRFDFAVVTTDDGADEAGRLRLGDYRGVPVFRLSTPQEVNMDWRPENPVVGRQVAEILELWRPDLVHAHSLQRLTGSALDACRAAGVPYVVTLHDAWWISDYNFLTDGRNRSVDPRSAWPEQPPEPATVGDSIARRRKLLDLLDGAEDVLGVSRAFTAIYREAGVSKARALPNGVPRMAVLPRERSPSGRVRLAQVGSQTWFKGYHHLQAALRQGRYADLELTVVDHHREGGAVETAIWGATPVRFVGKTRQEDMQGFYAEHDVLVAPSVWPESFGLVTREALNAGLWVLASDRGAIGEDVTPGVNGWVVQVDDLRGISAALNDMDADPQRYLEPPPPPEPPLRTSDDQARDLLALYADVAARPPPSPRAVIEAPKPPRVFSMRGREAALAREDAARDPWLPPLGNGAA